MTRSDSFLRENFPYPDEQQWREAADKLLKGAPFDKIMLTNTYEGITLKPIYNKKDTENLDFPHSLPGFYPYVRGTEAAGYLSHPWLIAQEITVQTPGQFNAEMRYNLSRGVSAITLNTDQTTARGLDSDQNDPEYTGRGGVAISTPEDLSRALNDIDLLSYPLFINAGTSALALASFLEAHCVKNNIDLSRLNGGFDSDPLTFWAQEGSLPISVETLTDEMAILTKWGIKKAPQLFTIGVRGDVFHNAGADAVTEIALALATASEYIAALKERSVAVDDIISRIRFTLGVGSSFFMELAKLRAIKPLWVKIAEAYGGDPEKAKINIHIRTSLTNKTYFDPYVNLLRSTTETFSAVLGGCDSIHVTPFDRPVKEEDEFSRRLARNIQIILKEEAHLDRVIDPAGGSWYVEALTAEIAEKAWELFRRIENEGGMTLALQKGIPAELIENKVQERKNNIHKRKDKLVGTNVYANLTEKPMADNRTDYEKIHRERSSYLKDYRTSGRVEQHVASLAKLGEIMEASDKDLTEALKEAALEGATLGEINSVLRSSAPSAPNINPLVPFRAAEDFEKLRMAMKEYEQKQGKPLTVFLANMGTVSRYKARADFSAGFFSVAGFAITDNGGFTSPEEAADAALRSGADIIVICSDDDSYKELVPVLTPLIKEQSPEMKIILAGYPKDMIDTYKNAGIDTFIHLRANAYEILVELMKNAGVLS